MLRKKKKRLLISILKLVIILAMFVFMFFGYKKLYDQVPDKLRFIKGKEQKFTFLVPMTADFVNVSANQVISRNEYLDHNKAVTLQMDAEDDYELRLKLFGVFPFKDIEMHLVEEQKLLPIGYPVGLYLDVEGIMVVEVGSFEGEDGNRKAPTEGVLRKGDYILRLNGKAVSDKESFMRNIENGDGKEVKLTIERDGIQKTVSALPVKNKEGKYKLGIWLRDDTQGIGTLTYLGPNGEFGALGHGMNDIDTHQVLKLQEGSIYETDIVKIEKSRPGIPGQLTGLIVYNEEKILGTVEKNEEEGIFGHCNAKGIQYIQNNIEGVSVADTPIAVGLKQEIKIGEAKILTTIDKNPDYYNVYIYAIHYDGEQKNRDIEFKVTDERLLNATGGIVQGMSGSPIIQNDKFIGAVTHVFVNDPTKGYGIFIEEMLEEQEKN